MRKLSKTKLKSKADKLVSEIVRSKGKCERCDRSSGVQLQAAHIVGRSNHTLRFDLKNVLCLCAGCHRWSHNNPDLFTHWWEAKYPERKVYLDTRRNLITKRKVSDYQDLIKQLS